VDELYVMARRVLLDALEALGAHRDAIILVGAQAVYLRVGEADLAVAPYTTDGDLAIDPSALGRIPPLERELIAAGFMPKTSESVGVWIARRQTSMAVETNVQIDLLVPASVSPGKGRRAARLPGHDSRAARIVNGLEGALVDADVLRVAALDPDDARHLNVRVAGSAALLVAKVHKIADRTDTDRLSDKDALDVLRLLRGTPTNELVRRFRGLLGDDRSAATAKVGRTLFEAQFAKRTGVGVEMAIRSAGPLADADEIAASCEVLAKDLLRSLEARGLSR
jgi:hypothetical protein